MEEKISRRERKKQLSREAILAAAAREFSQKGFRETSVADIMNAADLGIGTFYNYFESKEELLLILLGGLAKEAAETLARLREEHRPARELLLTGSKITARFLDENRFVLPLFLSGSITSALPEGTEHAQTMRTPGFKNMFLNIIEEGQASGEFRNDMPATLIAEMLHSIYQAASFSRLGLPFQENIALKAQILLDGIIKK